VRDANFYADVQYVPRAEEAKRVFLFTKGAFRNEAEASPASRKDARFWLISAVLLFRITMSECTTGEAIEAACA